MRSPNRGTFMDCATYSGKSVATPIASNLGTYLASRTARRVNVDVNCPSTYRADQLIDLSRIQALRPCWGSRWDVRADVRRLNSS